MVVRQSALRTHVHLACLALALIGFCQGHKASPQCTSTKALAVSVGGYWEYHDWIRARFEGYIEPAAHLAAPGTSSGADLLLYGHAAQFYLPREPSMA